MNNKDFGKNLEERTLKLALKVIHLSSTLPSTSEGRVVKNQFTKSGTSIGANYREVNRSRSNADFRNKMKICESETSETVYWLKIIEKQRWGDEHEIRSLLEGASELLGIFTSAGINTKKINSKL